MGLRRATSSGSTVFMLNVVSATSGCSSPSMIMTGLSAFNHSPSPCSIASCTWSSRLVVDKSRRAEASTFSWVVVIIELIGIILCRSSVCVAVGGGEGLGSVLCFDTPELSASMMVDSSAESGGPGEGVRRVNALRKGIRHLNHK